MEQKLTIAEKHAEIVKIFSTINYNYGKNYNDVKAIFLDSVYFKENKVDFYEAILFYHLIRESNSNSQDIFYSFLYEQLKNDDSGEIINFFKNKDFLTSQLLHRHDQSFNSDNLLKLFNEKGYYDKFSIDEYLDFVEQYHLTPLNMMHSFYFENKDKQSLIDFLFDSLKFESFNETKINKFLPLIKYVLDKNIIQEEMFINFILDSTLTENLKLEMIGIYSSYTSIVNNKDKIIKLIKDDFSFIKNNLNKDILNILRKYDKNMQLIDAGSYLTRLNIFIHEHEEKEAIVLFAKFRKDYPNLYNSLYKNNKKIRNSPNPQYKSFVERIHLKITFTDSEFDQTFVKKRL